MSGASSSGDGSGGDGKRRRRKSSSGKRSSSGDSGRSEDLAVRVKTARGRKLSSTLWLQRQLNDPYVRRAKAEGYRSRAAYKLLELDEKFRLLRRGARIVDLGAAPGGWCQAAHAKGAAHIVGVDLLEMEPIGGVTLLQGDFTEAETVDAVREALGGPVDLVLSDMAPNTSGHRDTDHVRTVALVEAAAAFAQEALAPGGALVAKTFQGGADARLLTTLKQAFGSVRHAKPPASRTGSPETYLVAQNFRANTKP